MPLRGLLGQHLAGAGIERDQRALIAGAEQAVRGEIEIEAVRAAGGDGERARRSAPGFLASTTTITAGSTMFT